MMANSKKDREIVVKRVIDAPRELVFAAFTEQKHAEEWWVPNGTTHEWNGGPGGLWQYSQPGPGGTEYPYKVKFIEVEKPTRFVYDFAPDTADAPEPVRTTVTFEEEGGKTKVTLQLMFVSKAEREKAVKYGAIVGAMQALENLADYLAKV